MLKSQGREMWSTPVFSTGIRCPRLQPFGRRPVEEYSVSPEWSGGRRVTPEPATRRTRHASPDQLHSLGKLEEPLALEPKGHDLRAGALHDFRLVRVNPCKSPPKKLLVPSSARTAASATIAAPAAPGASAAPA